MSYPASDLLFILAVASSGLQCVTDAEDTQLAKGQRWWWGGASEDIKQTCYVCVFLPSMCILCRLIHSLSGSLSASGHSSAGS